MQRLRTRPAIRALLSENHLVPAHFIQPLFVHEGLLSPCEITALPGVWHHTQESVLKEAEALLQVGIRHVLLFGIPIHKSHDGALAYADNGVVQTAIGQLKSHFPELVVIADCCFCDYTSTGHCLLSSQEETKQGLAKIACSYAHAGVDVVAPSAMVDGQVESIRRGLDEAGFASTLILSYAAKYASAFYGPFRVASGSADCFTGDRRHHQINPTQRYEAIREVRLDEEQGADMVMVKPGTPYLDIVRDIKNKSLLPLAVYQVSGEYAMLKQAARQGIVNEMEAFLETFVGFRRAGADLIVSYYAKTWATHNALL